MTLLDQMLQALLLLSGATAIFLIKETGRPRRERWGFLIGALGQPVWLYVAWTAGQWGLFTLALFYTWGWTEGAWKRWRTGPG